MIDTPFRASGPDLAAFSDVVHSALPQTHFSLDGRVARSAQGFTLHALRARAGDDTAEVGGLVVAQPRLAGSDLHLKTAGPNLARFMQTLADRYLSDLQVRMIWRPDRFGRTATGTIEISPK